jgi:hypothetical protein
MFIGSADQAGKEDRRIEHRQVNSIAADRVCVTTYEPFISRPMSETDDEKMLRGEYDIVLITS